MLTTVWSSTTTQYHFTFNLSWLIKAVHSTAQCPEEVGHKNQILELVNENLLVVLL